MRTTPHEPFSKEVEILECQNDQASHWARGAHPSPGVIVRRPRRTNLLRLDLVFADDAGKTNRSLVDIGGAALVVSQFTLYGDARGQRRTSFVKAAPPDEANCLYEEYRAALRSLGVRVETGIFQARMAVESTNDGPVTILLDSERLF
jgi:hypothetical protein